MQMISVVCQLYSWSYDRLIQFPWIWDIQTIKEIERCFVTAQISVDYPSQWMSVISFWCSDTN